MAACITNQMPFCQLQEPAYSMSDSSSCIVSLKRQDPVAVEKYCSPVIRPANSSPKGYYLAMGKWLLVSRPPTRLAIVCPTGTTSLLVTKPVQTVQLKPECSASGDAIYLPPYYASDTHLDLPDFTPLDPGNFTQTIPIWKPRWKRTAINPNFTSLPPLHTNGMPADQYFNEVEALPLEDVFKESPTSFSRTWTLTISIGLIAIAFIYFIYLFILRIEHIQVKHKAITRSRQNTSSRRETKRI